jgi:hypothetical protein
MGTGVVGIMERGQRPVTITPATDNDAAAQQSQRIGFTAASP